jgi:hypothetical protein
MSHRLLFQAAARSTAVMLRRSSMRAAVPTTSMQRASNLLNNLQPITQMRFFSKKGGSFKNKQNKLALQVCYGPHDVEMDPDPDELITGVHNNMKDIKKHVAENVGWDVEDIDVMEYYENGEWKELKNPSQIEGKKQVAIRIPELFEEYGTDEQGDDEEYEDYNENDMDDEDFDRFDREELYDTIKGFVEVLKQDGFAPDPSVAGRLQSMTAESISTKEWILKRAEEDKDLQKILLSKPGALKHIVECLEEYAFLWTDKEGEKESADEPSSE